MLLDRRHTVGNGLVRLGHNHRFRFRASVVGIHVRRGAADHRVSDQRPDWRPRCRVQPVGNDVLHVPGREQRRLGRHGHRHRVHSVSVGVANRGRDARRSRGPETSELGSEVREQVSVVRGHGQELYNRHRVHRDELRFRQFPGRRFVIGRRRGVAVQDHRHDPGGPTSVRSAPVFGATWQRDRRVRRHGDRNAIERGRLAADRPTREHIHLQVVRKRQARGRHARTARDRLVQHWQLVRARVPRFRVV